MLVTAFLKSVILYLINSALFSHSYVLTFGLYIFFSFTGHGGRIGRVRFLVESNQSPINLILAVPSLALSINKMGKD